MKKKITLVIIMCEWIGRRNVKVGFKLAEWAVAVSARTSPRPPSTAATPSWGRLRPAWRAARCTSTSTATAP